MKRFIYFVFSLGVVFTTKTVFTQVPSNYYDSANGLSGSTLKQELHDIITSGHSVLSYTYLWTAFQVTDRDNYYESDNSVMDMYTEIPAGADTYNFTYTTDQCGTYSAEGDCYNREHSFPKSWWGGAESGDKYSDLNHLVPTDGYVNNMRSSYAFGEVTSPTYTSSNGSKRGSNDVAGSGFTGVVFEPIDEFKGDFARILFYMATRYKDEIPSWVSSYGGTTDIDVVFQSSGEFQTWYYTMLYDWHTNDPVSTKETDRNDDVYDEQGNANPYINHPEWVCEVFGTCTVNPEPDNHVTVFAATANGSSQIDLSWTDAIGTNLPDYYLIKANTTGTFSNPVDGTDPSTDTDLSDGSAVVKVAHGAKGSHSFTGLTGSTTYYFKIWSYTNTGSDIDFKLDGTVPTGNATTAAAAAVETIVYQDFGSDGGDWNYTPNPSSFNTGGDVWTVTTSLGTLGTVPTSLSNFWGISDLACPSGTSVGGWGTITFDQVDISGHNNVVLTFDYENDGFDSGDDMKYQVFYDGAGQGEVTFVSGNGSNTQGTISVNVPDGTNTLDLVVSVSQNGSDYGGLDNFLVEGEPASSNDATSTVSASTTLTEPATIASTYTSSTGLQVFDFTLTDPGSGDGLATIIDQIQITQGSANAVADWTNAIAGAVLNGPGLTNMAGTVNATNITFASNDMISVADGSANAETFTLSIWLNTDLSGITDNNILEFAMSYSSITEDAAGSSFGSGAPESGDANVAIDITATQLLFVQQPTTTQVNSAMSPNPTVKACDANGNVDTDYSTAISVTSSGTLSGTPVSGTWSSGVATFSSLTHTATGTGLALTAASGALANEVSSTFDINAAPVTINEENFSNCGSLTWTAYDVAGDDSWTCGSGYDEMNGYGGTTDEDWLISPALNLNAYSSEVMTFETAKDYSGPDLALVYSTDYDGSSDPSSQGTWNSLTFTKATNTTFTSSGDVDLSGISGTSVYIAFHYTATGTGSGQAEMWRVDNILISGLSGNDVTSTVTAGAAAEPATIASTYTSSTGLQVFDFTFTDAGSGDGLSTILDGLQITQGSANAVADWTNAIAGAVLNGSGVTNMAGTVNATNITFTGNDMISVADGGNETYTLSIWLITDLSSANDNDVLEFAMDYNNITADAAGSQFGSGAPESGNTNVAIDISATKLLFVQQPTNTEAGVAMSPNPTVEATDANNNRDTDFSTAVTVASTGTMTGDPVSGSWSSGVATFSSLTHTATGTGLTLSTTCAGVTDATSTTFNITGNSASDIILNTSFTEPTNIAYGSYQAADITGGANDLEIAQFIIRDGGAGTDADGLGTILTDISFSLSNSANIRRVAIYDGATEVAEVAGGATADFSSISLTATDNLAKTFSVRVSFNATVTDNEQFQFAVTAATADAAGSGFAAADAGGASSSVAGDDNRIEVVATALNFAQQPADANPNGCMASDVAVEFVDANANRDLDETSTVRITSTGTLSTTPLDVAAVSGLATFSGASCVNHTAEGTNLTLNAERQASLDWDISSNQFDVIAPSVLEYGDLAIVAVNTGQSGGDEISFVAFVDINPGTAIDFTDNGYERATANLWGDTEGTLRFTRTGTTISAGEVITFVGSDGGATPVLGTDFDIYVGGSDDQSNWSLSSLNGSSAFNMNSSDQIWIMQNGTWTNGGGSHDATYDGNILYGWTATGWEPLPGYGTTDGSTKHEDAECSITNVTGTTNNDKVKYTGPTTAATKIEWIGRINDKDNWTGYADNASFDAGSPQYKSSGATLAVNAGSLDAGKWAGYKSDAWCDCANWMNLQVPTAATDVTVPGGSVNDILLSSHADSLAVCNNLLLDGNDTIFGVDGSQITINGNLTFNGGVMHFADSAVTVYVHGNWVQDVEAAFVPGNASTVQLAGAGQNISLTGAGNVNLNNITFAGSGTKTNSDDLNIGGDLTINSGATFDPGSTQIYLTGNFANNNSSAGYFDGSQVNLQLNGSSQQTFTSSAGSETVFYLDLLNGASLLLASDLNITSSIVMYDNTTLDFGATARSLTLAGMACATNVTIDMSDVVAHNLYLNMLTPDINGQTLSMSTASIVHYNRAGNQTLLADITNYTGNLVLSNSGTKTIGNNPLTIGGDFTVSGTAVASPTASPATINIGGDYSVWGDGAFNLTTNNHAIVFNGTAAQDISGAETFHDITFNNTSGFTVSNDISIDGTFTITNGGVNTGANTIDLGANGTISGENETNNIVGFVSATRNIGLGSAETFGGIGMSITENGGSNSTTVIRATGSGNVQTGNSSCCGSNQSIYRYYDISTASGVSNATMVYSYFDAELNGATEANLELYSAALPVSGSDPWTKRNGSVNTTSNTITLSGINGFSRWTAAPSDAPLPIDLMSFSGELIDAAILLNWTTASEINNDFFDIEKSFDAEEFLTVGVIEGAGNSNALIEYSFLDENPYSGTNYYRLKQVDFNGSFEYSEVIAIDFGIDSKLELVINEKESVIEAIVRNPNKEQPIVIEVFDMAGKLLYSKELNFETTSGRHAISKEYFEKGMYLFNLRSDKSRAFKKVVF